MCDAAIPPARRVCVKTESRETEAPMVVCGCRIISVNEEWLSCGRRWEHGKTFRALSPGRAGPLNQGADPEPQAEREAEFSPERYFPRAPSARPHPNLPR